MVAIGADSFVEASCQLGEPGQRGEPRGFQTGVLESFFADGVGHDDRGLDERKRVRVEQPVLPEHAADLSQLELTPGNGWNGATSPRAEFHQTVWFEWAHSSDGREYLRAGLCAGLRRFRLGVERGSEWCGETGTPSPDLR